MNGRTKNAANKHAPQRNSADQSFATELKGMISSLAKAMLDSTIGPSGFGQVESKGTPRKEGASNPAFATPNDLQHDKPVDESALILKELIKHLDL